MRKYGEYCGLCGVTGSSEPAAALVAEGLFAQQHRGQEAAGIVTLSSSGELKLHKRRGLVPDMMADIPSEMMSEDIHAAIGHVRYGTFGGSGVVNAQPIKVRMADIPVAIAHNGTISNAGSIRRSLQKKGHIFQTNTDTEIVLHLMSRELEDNDYNIEKCFQLAISKLEGAFCLLLLVPEGMYVVRDSMGFRPLNLGKIQDGGWVVASETIAFPVTGAEYVREIEPGEMLFFSCSKSDCSEPVVLDFDMSANSFFSPENRRAHCIFEHVYFARPGSYVFGDSVYATRIEMGRQLAREAPAECDMVMPVPDSGMFAAMGFARELGLPLDMGFTRNHYVGRTFIDPGHATRAAMVMRKLQPIPEAIQGKRVCVVEDSIVRGTTSRARIKALREAGAKEIHMRISCPPHRHACFFGIDFPEEKSLIANRYSVKEISEILGLDSLGYLTTEGMLSCVSSHKPEDYCTACFTGDYPVAPPVSIGTGGEE
ncbi:amidophosphoribosyltransferase [Candidatus Fermentibacteria bacterium]|nr:MAG: amidophosphoribosyltransferase [Candidatus Fermentibacteria bacterium]